MQYYIQVLNVYSMYIYIYILCLYYTATPYDLRHGLQPGSKAAAAAAGGGAKPDSGQGPGPFRGHL